MSRLVYRQLVLLRAIWPLLCLIALCFALQSAVLAQPGRPAWSPSAPSQGVPPQDKPPAWSARPFVEGELLVRFAHGPLSQEAQSAHWRMGAGVRRSFHLIGWQQVRLPRGMSVEEGIEYYRQMPGVAWVEPNYLLQASATQPNDPLYPGRGQWGMRKIGAERAWDTTTGSRKVVVAVLDAGINYNHDDLSANMWRNMAEVNGQANVDDDGNGKIDDIYGWDALHNDGDPMPDIDSDTGQLRNHGTHCAGILGAVGENGIGVVGVNWHVRIMALKFADGDGIGTSADAIECLDYVRMMKNRGVNVRVTSNSWSGGATRYGSAALKDAFDACGAAGILNVCAAGNKADPVAQYPARFDSPSIISVAASDADDDPASFTNYGLTSVDLAAPGVNVQSTIGTSSYGLNSGTSMATPHVAGAAALLLAYSPNLTAAQLKAALLNNVDVLPQWIGKVRSGGRLNVDRALESLR